jgi:hypothetical protein
MKTIVARTTLGGLLACMTSSAFAAPPAGSTIDRTLTTDECVAAHEGGLSLREQKMPHAAHGKFVACAHAECPVVVRKECVDQLAAVEREGPTVVLEAHDEDGSDTTAVRVTIDGAPLADRLTGTGTNVEPGEHVFRFEPVNGNPVEVRAVVAEGDKNRKIVALFGAASKSTSSPTERSGIPSATSRRIPPLALAIGGVALAGLGSFATFAVVGWDKESTLSTSCSPRCTDAELSPVKSSYLIADVSLVVGVVAATAAVLLALPSLRGAPQNAAHVALGPPPWIPKLAVRDARDVE